MGRFGMAVLLAGAVGVAACAPEPPVVTYPRHPSAYGHGGVRPGAEPLQRTARDARNVESIASSVSRIGRLLAGGY